MLIFFFFNDTATTEIYTLSLHDGSSDLLRVVIDSQEQLILNYVSTLTILNSLDRKSTRLNSSHGYISYAVFCLKKKKQKRIHVDFNSTQNRDHADVPHVTSRHNHEEPFA